MSIKSIFGGLIGSHNDIPASQTKAKPASPPPQPSDSFNTAEVIQPQTGRIDLAKTAELLTTPSKIKPPEMKWSINTSNAFSGSFVLTGDNKLVYANRSKGIICIDPNSKTPFWGKNFSGGEISNILLKGPDKDIIATALGGKRVTSLDIATGSQKWQIELQNPISGFPVTGKNGNVYIISDGKLLEFDGKSQKPVSETPLNHQTDGSPAIGKDGTVYISGKDGKLHACEKGTGKEKWASQTGTKMRVTPVISDDGTIFAAGNDCTLYAINPDNGSKKWNFKTESQIIAEPTFGQNGEIFLSGSDNHIYSIDSATGQEKWSFTANSDIPASPKQFKDGTIWAIDNQSRVYGINPENGSRQWSFKAAAFTHCQPDSDDSGNFYMECNDGNLYSYEISGAKEKLEKMNPKTDSETTPEHVKNMSVEVEESFVVIGGIKLPRKKAE